MKYEYSEIESVCPLCENKKGKLLYEINSDDASRYLAPRGNRDKINNVKLNIERLWNSKICKKILCSNCHLMHWDPFKGGDEKFYSETYCSPNKYPDWRWEYGLTINSISRIRKRNISIMEIGAGRGAFLKKIKPSLIKRKTMSSCEISNVGIKELEEMGVKNYKDLSTAPKNKFSVICMFDSIEHMDNLKYLFKNISKISSDNADIFISTHVQETVKFLELNNISLDLSPTHVSCWSEKSFVILCKKYGFKMVDRKLLNLNLFQRIVSFGFGRFEYKKIKKRSIEFKINRIEYKKLRKFITYIYLFFISPYAIFNAIKNTKMYSCQWVHLKRK